MPVLSVKALLAHAAPREEAAAGLGGSSKFSEEEKCERRLVALNAFAVMEKTYLLTCLFWKLTLLLTSYLLNNLSY